jgi:SAM-dependent methyltransferase
LTVDRPEHIPGKPVLIHRSPRWQNPVFPWRKVLDLHGSRCIFVGLPSEHEAFVKEFGPVPFRPTKNFLELARLIAGCELYIGNQSAPYAIAEAMKHNAVLEVWPEGPNCIFYRENVIHCDTADVYIPAIHLDRETDIELKECPACGSAEREPLFNGLFRCPDCCVAYPKVRMNPVREIDALQRITPASYLSPPTTVDAVKTGNLRRDYFVQEMVTRKAPPGHVLDCGCAWGGFLHAARRYGYSVEGIEANLAAASFARDILGIAVHNALFSSVDLGQDRYDIIVVAHTLEHLGKPSDVMPKLHRALKPGGMLCGLVCNIDSPTAQVKKHDWPWLDMPVHWVQYTPAAFHHVLEKHGFEVRDLYTEIGDYDRNEVAAAIQTLNPSLNREQLIEHLVALKKSTGLEEIRFFAFKPC